MLLEEIVRTRTKGRQQPKLSKNVGELKMKDDMCGSMMKVECMRETQK